MSSLIIGSDLGSSGCKTIALDVNSRSVVASSRRDYSIVSLKPGWAEQDPELWYRAFIDSVVEVVSGLGLEPDVFAALCIVGVTHTAVLLDDNDRPLTSSILMFDSRSQSQAQAIANRWGDEVERRTLNSPTPVWTWPQLAWVKENRPEIWAAIRRVVLQKDYVRERLGAGQGTDYIDAAGTLVFDPIHSVWIDDFLAELELDAAMLPSVTDPWTIVGELGAEASALTGLPAGLPVVTGTTDTVAEMVGSGALHPGQGVVKLASVGRLAVVAENPIVGARTLNYRHLIDPLWYPGTASKYAASAYNWLRRALWPEAVGSDVFRRMDASAEEVRAGSNALLFHPHLDGQWAPVWDDTLRGSFHGLTRRHDRAHITRAVLEGVGYAIKDALGDLEGKGAVASEFRLIGQGSRSRIWAQIMADILGRSLSVPAQVDAAFGAAIIGAIGVGLIDHDPAAIESLVDHQLITYEPSDREVRCYEELFAIYQESMEWQREISSRLTAAEQIHYAPER